MAKRKEKSAPRKLTSDERQLKKRMREVHRQVIPANVQAVLGKTEWKMDWQHRHDSFEEALLDICIRSSSTKDLKGLSQFILDTAPPVYLELIHQAFLSATRILPVEECRSENPIELVTDVMQWFERATRPAPSPPPDDGPKRDAMEAAMHVA